MSALTVVTVNLNKMSDEDYPGFLEWVCCYDCDVVFAQETENIKPDKTGRGYTTFQALGGRAMIILRSSLAKAVEFSNVSTSFSIVICDKIVLASVYLPNSQIKGDQFAASEHEFQTAVTQCFPREQNPP